MIKYSLDQIEEYFSAVEPVKEHIVLELDNGKYLYIIQLKTTDLGRKKLRSVDFSNFLPQLSSSVIADINNNLCKLVFDYSFEFFDCTHSHKADLCDFYIRETLNRYNLTKHQVAVISGNVKAFRDVPYTVALAERSYVRISQAERDFFNAQQLSIKNKNVRKHKLACLMNKPRFHRIRLAQELFLNNLLSDNVVSLNLNKNQIEKLLAYPGRYDSRFDSMFENSQNFLNSLPWKFDDFSDERDLMLDSYSPQEKLFLDTYVNVVVESLVDHTSRTNSEFELDISEKTYKPISRLQPFIVFGQEGLIAYLHSVGYKTFSQWWNEDYDNEPDSNIRMLKILDIIKQLSSLTHSELAEMLNDMLPVLEHNKEVFDSYVNNKKYIQEFNNIILSMFDKYIQ